MFENIDKDEWKFLGIIWLIVAVIVFLPIIVGYFSAPSGSVFLFRRNTAGQDYTVYFSQISQAMHGVYFFKDFFTPEHQTAGVLNPFWSLVGLLAVMFSLSSFVAFHFASFLLIPVFLLSSYCLISYFFEEKNKRKICFIFFVFASGIGWWIANVDPKIFSAPNLRIPSINIGESFTLNTLSNPPNCIASLILLILIFLFSLYAFEKYEFKYSLYAGICAFLLFSFHPYDVYTVFGVFLVFLIVEFFIERKNYINHIAHYVILLMFSMPPVIYYLWCFKNIPLYYQAYFLQNITLTPALWIVLSDYSVFLFLGFLGIISLFKNKNIDKKNIFLMVWAVVQFFLIYLPINTQRRLLEGLDIPIIILAIYGLFFLEDWLKNNWKPFYRFYCVCSMWLFVCIFCYSNFFLFLSNSVFAQSPADYLSKYDDNAMLWIKENTPGKSVILSSYENSNIIPAISYRQVYCGHWSATVEVSQKLTLLDDFFEKDNSQERQKFLENNNINYLFWGPEEKALAKDFNPDKENFLAKVYGNKAAAVYKID